MTNKLSIKSVLHDSQWFYKNNINDLSELIVKYCLLTLGLNMILVIVQKYLGNFILLNMVIIIAYLIILYCSFTAFYISITRSVILDQWAGPVFFQNIFTKTVLKIFLYTIGFFTISAMYFAIPIWLAMNINGPFGLIPITFAGLIFCIIAIRFSTVIMHVIIRDKISLLYNWRLTKNNFFKILGLLLIHIVPIMSLSTPSLFSSSSMVHMATDPATSFDFNVNPQVPDFTLNNIIKSSILQLVLTYIIAFFNIVFPCAYIHLTKITSDNNEKSS